MKYNIVKERQKRRVRKSNALINAREKNTLSALEQKLLLYAITELDGEDPSKALDIDFRDFMGRNKLTSNHYRDIRKASKSLATATIAFEEEKDGNFKRGEYIPLFSRIIAEGDKGELRFEFNPLIIPHITDLKRSFTSYRYLHIEGMKSSFSIRIYELLVQGAKKYTSREFDLDELKKLLGLTETPSYKKFATIRRNVLDRACTEINAQTDLEVSWEASKKKGKKVTHVMFYMGEKNALDTVSDTVTETLSVGLSKEIQAQVDGMRKLGLKDIQIEAALGIKIPAQLVQSEQENVLQELDSVGSLEEEEKKSRLFLRLQEYGLSAKLAKKVVVKTKASSESGIWKTLHTLKLDIQDGKVKKPSAYLKTVLETDYKITE